MVLVEGLGARRLGPGQLPLGGRGLEIGLGGVQLLGTRAGLQVAELGDRPPGFGRPRLERREDFPLVEHRERVAHAHRVAFVHPQGLKPAPDLGGDVHLVELDGAAPGHAAVVPAAEAGRDQRQRGQRADGGTARAGPQCAWVVGQHARGLYDGFRPPNNSGRPPAKAPKPVFARPAPGPSRGPH